MHYYLLELSLETGPIVMLASKETCDQVVKDWTVDLSGGDLSSSPVLFICGITDDSERRSVYLHVPAREIRAIKATHMYTLED